MNEIKKLNQLKSDTIQFNYIKYKFNRAHILMENDTRYLLELELNKKEYSYNICAWFEKKFTTLYDFGLSAVLSFPESFKINVFSVEKFKENRIDWKAPMEVINLFEYVESNNITNLEILKLNK